MSFFLNGNQNEKKGGAEKNHEFILVMLLSPAETNSKR